MAARRIELDFLLSGVQATAAELVELCRVIRLRRSVYQQTRQRLAEANLKTGTMLLLDVLTAQDLLEAARLRYGNAVTHYNQSQVNLLAALGILDPGSFSHMDSPAARQGKMPDGEAN